MNVHQDLMEMPEWLASTSMNATPPKMCAVRTLIAQICPELSVANVLRAFKAILQWPVKVIVYFLFLF